ncbi:thiamine-monophosphate kinase [Acidimicrobium ferrooxidans DSM 10331]|uniref:Thiamine-monophosphate kinase n=1 Tax=Acidimicrobium ferrooxidans (strain DSM 10331 / JCM 15462 / NBRC 103882 / ICP) TaxID=525909 RepID=C7LY34_ACIFD|nr:thiamine-phosphate kinase [Acidimicrobium ferrooxidans]ACU53642.1 thiamine-monophosphate kinase [Acidimicrobium ferrooxidans DSM 10331]
MDTNWREDEVIEAVIGAGSASLAIGDDTATIAPSSKSRVWCSDLVVDGVHVEVDRWPLAAIAHKAVAVNLSDLAAAGATPEATLLALACPPAIDARAIAVAVAEAADRLGAPLVGGDTTRGATLTLCVTALGQVDGTPLTRRGARSGDHLLVTGPLGAASAGLRRVLAGEAPEALPRHLHDALFAPQPRLAHGQLAASYGASAAIDVSDGFSLDLHRLADRSGVGFELDHVPIAPDATLADALGGGEDYELVIAIHDPSALIDACRAAGLREPIVVGRIVADARQRTLGGEPLAPRGWIHGASSPDITR